MNLRVLLQISFYLAFIMPFFITSFLLLESSDSEFTFCLVLISDKYAANTVWPLNVYTILGLCKYPLCKNLIYPGIFLWLWCLLHLIVGLSSSKFLVDHTQLNTGEHPFQASSCSENIWVTVTYETSLFKCVDVKMLNSIFAFRPCGEWDYQGTSRPPIRSARASRSIGGWGAAWPDRGRHKECFTSHQSPDEN